MRIVGARRRLELGEGVGVPGALGHRRHHRARRDVADPGQQHEDSIPAHFVARILDDAQERENVLHVGRLEELEASPFLERHLAIRQLDLEVGRHVAGANEDGDLAQRRAVFVQLENAVDDEARLLLLVARRDEPWRFGADRCVQRFFVYRSGAREMSVFVTSRIGWVER